MHEPLSALLIMTSLYEDKFLMAVRSFRVTLKWGHVGFRLIIRLCRAVINPSSFLLFTFVMV